MRFVKNRESIIENTTKILQKVAKKSQRLGPKKACSGIESSLRSPGLKTPFLPNPLDTALTRFLQKEKFMVSWSHFKVFTQRLKDFSFLDIFKNVHFQKPSASFF